MNNEGADQTARMCRVVCAFSVRIYAVILSKYATKIVGMQDRQVACVHGMQDQKQVTLNKFKSAQ